MACGLFICAEGYGNMNDKLKVARLSVVSGVLLTVTKLIAGLNMNSISVISEAIHSGLDLVAALIAWTAVWLSGQPADERHHYGHGKFENIAAIIEALLIAGAGALIILQAVPKLKEDAEIHSLGLGAAVMGLSAAVNFVVSAIIMRTARKTESPALAADGWHLRTDVYTSFGVLSGIIAIRLTGLAILDPLIALGVSLLIFKAAFDLLRESLGSILDVRLSETEVRLIQEVIEQHAGQFVEFHNLRTRRAGSERYVDLHLVVPRRRPIGLVHELCEQIEEDMTKSFSAIQVLIHTEPCQPESGDCKVCTMKIRLIGEGGQSEMMLCDKCPESDYFDTHRHI